MSRALRILVAIATTILTGAVASTATAADPGPGQGQWFNYDKDLKDPTFTYTQQVYCNSFTPGGQSTLYPYNVPTTGYMFEWRNNSTDGVTVTPNSTSTDSDMDSQGLAFFVTSLHAWGDYAMKVSILCQSNHPKGVSSVNVPKVTSVGTTTASVELIIGNRDFEGSTFTYFVQYGTGYASYSKSASVNTSFDGDSSNRRTVQITGLQPGTTYHFRGGVQDTDVDFPIHPTSYSGVDQTFTTAKAGLSDDDDLGTQAIELGAPAAAEASRAAARPVLRLTAPRRHCGRVTVQPESPDARQRWSFVDAAGAGEMIRSAHTGHCLDVRRNSGRPGAALVMTRCRTGERHQRWRRQRHGAGHWRLINLVTGHSMRAAPAAGTVTQDERGRRVRWRTSG